MLDAAISPADADAEIAQDALVSSEDLVSAGQDASLPSCGQPQLDPNAEFQPGQAYFSDKSYIEYLPGDLPIVISAPHGGSLKPKEIPDRSWGTMVLDTHSMEYTLETLSYLLRTTEHRPHVIINRLSRKKLDANRPIEEAAQGNPIAEKAWKDFHAYIQIAKARVLAQCGAGLYLDFHTTGHAEAWVELGYRLKAADLKQPDVVLDTPLYVAKSSLRELASQPTESLSALIRGPDSVGAWIESGGYKVVPSPKHPHPGAGSYFNGGYNTEVHGSKAGGKIDGMQVETYTKFIESATRTHYANTLGAAILHFVETHYGFNLSASSWLPPANALCAGAEPLKWVGSKAVASGTTTGVSDEFPGEVKCGHSFALSGPQRYYALELKQGKFYEIEIHADYPMRPYLFFASGDCSGAAIDASCAKSGLSGGLISTNTSQKIVIKAPTSGVFIVALDSRNAAWHGPFELSIEAL